MVLKVEGGQHKEKGSTKLIFQKPKKLLVFKERTDQKLKRNIRKHNQTS
jgi:hypothetical protein